MDERQGNSWSNRSARPRRSGERNESVVLMSICARSHSFSSRGDSEAMGGGGQHTPGRSRCPRETRGGGGDETFSGEGVKVDTGRWTLERRPWGGNFCHLGWTLETVWEGQGGSRHPGSAGQAKVTGALGRSLGEPVRPRGTGQGWTGAKARQSAHRVDQRPRSSIC